MRQYVSINAIMRPSTPMDRLMTAEPRSRDPSPDKVDHRMRSALQAITVALGGLFAVACTSRLSVTRRALVFEDGLAAEYLECSNAGLCVEEARRLCPAGYDVLASNDWTGAVAPRPAKRASGTAMVVACKGARAGVARTCGDRTGNYQVSRVPRVSTCADVVPSEVVALDDIPDERRPCRTTERSRDGCALRTIDDCVQAGRRGLVVETTNWSTDTASGSGVQQFQLYDVATGTLLCSGTYDVTYTRL
jgi:hypothetical protein